ncbi:MAG TPA: hypothetical protein VM056_05080 [Terriglobales bacterium]|nr:hypothetical protein [Terriglobales bacterium]
MRSFRRLAPFLVLTLLCSAQQSTFTKVKVRFSKPDDRRMFDKDVDLAFNDVEKRLITRGEHNPISVPYDDVQKVVFDVSRHMRGGAMSQVVGGLVGAAIAAQRVNDYWMYIEYKGKDGKSVPYLVEVDKDNAETIINKAKSIFGDRVQETSFPEVATDIEKNTLKDLQSKHEMEPNKKDHPLPELKADKALVVIACPSLAARYAGKGIQFKFHANDKVVAVNKWGTYSFVYLDPGEYTLVSQTENASAIKIKLEAGKDYYFLQNTFMGAWKAKTGLSRHAKELVMYEIDGAYYADWKAK